MPGENHSALLGLIRSATPFEIGLVAFLLFPPILLGWVGLLTTIFPTAPVWAKVSVALVAGIAYIVFVARVWKGKIGVEKKVQAEKERTRSLIARALQPPHPKFRNTFWIAIESGLTQTEAEEYLCEMVKDGIVERTFNEAEPHWGILSGLRDRER